MSKQNKWAQGYGKMGQSASGGNKVNGSNTQTYNAPKAGSAPRDSSSVKENKTTTKWSPGDSMGTDTISTHNDINRFTRGIKSRGPYGGPSFASINNSKQDMQSSNTSRISDFPTPSGNSGVSRGSAGGSGYSVSGPKTNVGSGKAGATSQMAKAPRSNKSGSGKQNLA